MHSLNRNNTTFLYCALLAYCLSTGATNAQQIDLLSEAEITYTPINCMATRSEGKLSIETNTDNIDALIDCDLSSASKFFKADQAKKLQLKMKTAVHAEIGEYIVYWQAEGERGWKNFERILLRPDGKWHKYQIPLAPSGQLKSLRFTFGKQSHRLQLADIQLVGIKPKVPAELESRRLELPSTITISREELSLRVNTADHTYSIADKRTGRLWQSESVLPWLLLCDVERQNEHRLRILMFDQFAQQTVTGSVDLASNRSVRFTLDTASPEAPIAGSNRYPPRFSTDYLEGEFVFCDRSCGVLLDQRDGSYANWPLRVYGNTHCLDMPWMGVYDSKRGDGMMLLVETPADAEVALVRHTDDRHWAEVRWLPSLDTFRYSRSATLQFTESDGYVGLARAYRNHLKATGRFRTLKQKAAAKPLISRLRGAPAIWGGKSPTKFVQEMRPLGVQRGIINGCKDPNTVSWLNELGYLTGRYDSYTDFLPGKTTFQRDRVDKAAIRSRPGGAPKHGWKLRSGEQMFWRSSALWLTAATNYLEKELRKIPYTARFIDVAAAADLLEDFHPEHTFDRRQDLINRRAIYDRVNDFGLVLGTEHGNDWVTDQVEYFEGSMSGPFWWSSWPAGFLDRPRKDQLTDKYLKFGMGYSNRIPLWELVYHDCAVSTWYWGDTAGMLNEAAPELANRKDLYNILYGTPPLLWMNGTGYQLPADKQRMLRTYHDTCPLHEVVAFEQMLEHEFLTADRAVQRTRFSNGTVAIVNFANEPHACTTDEGEVVLAPEGYYVKGPQISQTRLWVDDAAQTIISKPQYLTVDADGKKLLCGVKCNGRLTTFMAEPHRWNLFSVPGCQVELNIPEVTGWQVDEKIQLYKMDSTGMLSEIISVVDEDGVVRFQATEETWRFALMRVPPGKKVATRKSAPKNPTIANSK